jgi:hypothetical protein
MERVPQSPSESHSTHAPGRRAGAESANHADSAWMLEGAARLQARSLRWIAVKAGILELAIAACQLHLSTVELSCVEFAARGVVQALQVAFALRASRGEC